MHLYSESEAARKEKHYRFKLPSVPATTSKTIRFPNDLLTEVEKAIHGTDRLFSVFVIQAVRLALEVLEEQEDGQAVPPENEN